MSIPIVGCEYIRWFAMYILEDVLFTITDVTPYPSILSIANEEYAQYPMDIHDITDTKIDISRSSILFDGRIEYRNNTSPTKPDATHTSHGVVFGTTEDAICVDVL
jgi:hypothetical protein